MKFRSGVLNFGESDSLGISEGRYVYDIRPFVGVDRTEKYSLA